MKNSRKGKCWNKASALRDVVHEKLKVAIIEKLNGLDHLLLQIAVGLQRALVQAVGAQDEKLLEMLAKKKKLEDKRDSLVDAIELIRETHEPLEVLVKRLVVREAKLARVTAEIKRIEDPNARLTVPDVEELRAARSAIIEKLAGMDRASGAVLKLLTHRILAVPFQQFGTNKVVLRARFELDLRALLPPSMLLHLETIGEDEIGSLFPPIPMLVDLFTPSTGPKYGLEALTLRETGLTLREVGSRLGVGRHTAHVAIEYGKQLRAEGLTDAFIELTAAPAAGSRWRTHARFLQRHDTNRPNDAAA